MKATLSDDLAAAGNTFGTWELGDMARRPGGALDASGALAHAPPPWTALTISAAFARRLSA